jgi:hypothetical protein
MALAHEVRSFFGGKVRLRGHEYFERRAVTIDHGDAWYVQAWVRGTGRYRVTLNRLPSGENRVSSRLTVWCTCPYAEGGEACKHIWATVLAATAQGLLAGDGHQQITDLRLSALDDDEIAAGFTNSLPPDIGDLDTDADVFDSDDLDQSDDLEQSVDSVDSVDSDDSGDFARPAPKTPASPLMDRARDGRDRRDRPVERDGRDERGGRGGRDRDTGRGEGQGSRRFCRRRRLPPSRLRHTHTRVNWSTYSMSRHPAPTAA